MLQHGGKLRQAAAHYNIPLDKWLDLSTGVSPWHYPLTLLPADCLQRLPEENDGLEEAAAVYYGCHSLLPVAGSQAAIQLLPSLLPRSQGPVLLPRIGYQEHHAAWRKTDAELMFYDTQPTAEQLAICSVLLVIQPNNPRGIFTDPQQLRLWQQQLAARQAWLIIDEAFTDCTSEISLTEPTPQPYTVILRSLGKFFGLAGLRVGFVLAHENLLVSFRTAIGPWSVSGPARYIAREALQDNAWQQQQRSRLTTTGQRLQQLIAQHQTRLGGSVAATALFCRWETKHAEAWHYQLCQQGILTRLTDEKDALRFGLPKEEHDWQRLEQTLMKMSGTAK